MSDLATRTWTLPSPVLFPERKEPRQRWTDHLETAFGLREDQWDYDIISQWTNPDETDMHIQWTRDFFNRVEPFTSGGVYVNHLDADEGDRIQGAYGNNYERLLTLKNKYDPTNLFRLNQNIKPTE